MTDRFYPIPAAAEPATVMPGMASRNIGEFHRGLYQTTYQSLNRMSTFPRSPYPPGYAGHLPGCRDKFGYGSPGPEADIGLTRPESCPGLLSLKQTQGEDGLDALWSSVRGSGGSKKPFTQEIVTSPSVGRKSRIAALASKGIVGHMEDTENKYFVPDSMSEWPQERVSRAQKILSKLEKKNPITGGNGQGTGFNSQRPGCQWWPNESQATRTWRQRSVYNESFKDKPYHPKSGFYPAVR